MNYDFVFYKIDKNEWIYINLCNYRYLYVYVFIIVFMFMI